MTLHETKPFNVEGLAQRWEVTPRTIYSMIDRGDLASFRVGKSCIRIAAEEVYKHEAGKCGGLNSTGANGAQLSGKTAKPSDTPSPPRIGAKLSAS